MKKTILMLLSMLILFSANIHGQRCHTPKTSFKVSGNCDMCKERIEKAAKIEGVKNAIWNQETHILTVAFVPTKTTLDQIQQNIANTGYDTDKFKASDRRIYKNCLNAANIQKNKIKL
jgi:hypothetical protein